MARVSPWHAEDSNVYHDYTNCTEGNTIDPRNRRFGTGNKRRCPRCQELSAQDRRSIRTRKLPVLYKPKQTEF